VIVTGRRPRRACRSRALYLQDAAHLAYATGWRRGELASLEWADVDRVGRRLTLRHKTVTETRKAR